eukprot:7060640-Prymnesium_polylepis.3
MQELPQHDRKGVDLALGVDFVVLKLLGRLVRGRTQCCRYHSCNSGRQRAAPRGDTSHASSEPADRVRKTRDSSFALESGDFALALRIGRVGRVSTTEVKRSPKVCELGHELPRGRFEEEHVGALEVVVQHRPTRLSV